MPDVITIENADLIDIGRVVISTSPRLYPNEWEEQPYLMLMQLDLMAGPSIDRAQIAWRYGSILPYETPGEQPNLAFVDTPQLDIIGHFVKIEIFAPDNETLLRVWYGIIEAEANEVFGKSAGMTRSAGVQTFTAWGLLRLLERVYFRSSLKFRDPTETEPVTLARGLPFNMSTNGDFAETGNRSASLGPGGTYLFSDAPELADEWTAWTAAEYLLENHSPIDDNDNPLATWELQGDSAILDWYVIHTRTDGRSVKELIDELIPRKRAVGYWVDYDEDLNRVTLNLFSLNGSDLVLPTGTIPANPLQYELDFETQISIERTLLRNVLTTTYHRIVARGENRSSTATFRFNPQYAELDKAWSDDLETAYLDAAENSPGYGSLSLFEKYQKNALSRAQDKFRPVFRRFQLSTDWNERVGTLFQNEDIREWHAVPRLVDGVPQPEYDAGSNPSGETIWRSEMRFLRRLALLENRDYTGDRIETGEFSEPDEQDVGRIQNVRPMFFYRAGGGDVYVLLEHLGMYAGFEDEFRAWAIQPEILEKGPTLELHVNGGPQQFMADSWWGDAAETDPAHDPAKNNGIDYIEFYATLTIDTGIPFEVGRDVFVPGPSGTGVQKRTLYIDVPDARHDYVVPYTVTELNDDPGVGQTETGGLIRDDTERLELIADSAAAWYGTLRQTLEMSIRQIPLTVSLGALIVALPSDYDREEVNTVVTRISYSLPDAKRVITEVETSFAEFELV